MGRMEVGPEILGYGSSGTLVFEGTLHGRPIAVKRLLRQACPPSCRVASVHPIAAPHSLCWGCHTDVLLTVGEL